MAVDQCRNADSTALIASPNRLVRLIWCAGRIAHAPDFPDAFMNQVQLLLGAATGDAGAAGLQHLGDSRRDAKPLPATLP